MKKVIRLTESQLEEIVRRVIAEQEDEQEDYAPPGGWNEEQLQYHEKEAKRIFKSSDKPNMGGYYCFLKKEEQKEEQKENSVMKELKRSIRISGSEGKSLYKIKRGDTPDGIKKMVSSNYNIERVNSKSCNMNEPREGDVILIRN
jgi:hypothetical protein